MIFFSRFLRPGKCPWRRSACPLPSIRAWRPAGCGLACRRRLSARSGQADVVAAMFFFLMVLIVALFQFRVYVCMVAGAYVEDALAVSNLASALIDVEEYGRSHSVRIGDTQNAFRVYRDALYDNLALDEEGYSAKEDLLAGQVELREYIVYNVSDQEIQISVYDGEGNCLRQERERPGEARTPDGVAVEHTTVYSRVGFRIRGLMGRTMEAEKEKSVDR